MSQTFEYCDPSWRTQTFHCPACGWSGRPFDDMAPEGFRELMHFECGACEMILVIVVYPTVEETRTAAAAGNAEAKWELRRWEDDGKDST